MSEPIHYQSLVQVAREIETGALSPVALTETMLARGEAENPKLNAYLAIEADNARAQAATAEAELKAGRYRGPLHGVPIAIKDLFHVKGAPATFGGLVHKAFVPEQDATIVARLKQAGAVILGRLHLHEGAFGEHHPDLGKCLNPWNTDYWPGGSSSGSGSATAAGLCYASLGTDTGGSIRFPSAACGLTGLKVTWGRTSRAGAFPLAESLDTIGPMARSAADAAAMLDAFAGPDPRDPTSLPSKPPDYLAALKGVEGARGYRIGVDDSYLRDGVDAETIQAIYAALDVFHAIGVQLVPIRVPDRREAIAAQILITDTECARFHRAAYEADKAAFGPMLAGAIERGLASDPLALAGAYVERDRFRGEMARAFEAVDAIVSPIYPVVGLRYDEMHNLLADLPRVLGYTAPYNVSGNPSLTMPCGLAKVGMPLALQLIGPHLGEDALLRAGHAFQSATDWHVKHPPLF
jgi:amidase